MAFLDDVCEFLTQTRQMIEQRNALKEAAEHALKELQDIHDWADEEWEKNDNTTVGEGLPSREESAMHGLKKAIAQSDPKATR